MVPSPVQMLWAAQGGMKLNPNLEHPGATLFPSAFTQPVLPQAVPGLVDMCLNS